MTPFEVRLCQHGDGGSVGRGTDGSRQMRDRERVKSTSTTSKEATMSGSDIREPEVEGHLLRGHSDENLKQAVAEIENAIEKLRALLAANQSEVEGHLLRGHSDENLKQAVAQIEDAMEKLRALLAAAQADVEGHPLRRS
jgi:hypothetical protein